MAERTGDTLRNQENCRPILILGLTQRTGTNFLMHILQFHEDCTIPRTLFEDFLVSEMGQLDSYVASVSRVWVEKSGADGKSSQLYAALGLAIEDFLIAEATDAGKRPVFKTPSVKGLGASRLLLKNTDIVVLLRSGPAVIESGMRSFGWDFDDACREWHEAAQIVTEQWREAGTFFSPGRGCGLRKDA